MIHRLFVYGTLLGEERLKLFIGEEAEVISIKPGFIEGKMYDGFSFPMVVELGELTKPKMPNICFGGIAEIESEDILFWESLDAYEGCSLFRLGENRKHDLYHRKEVQASIINAKSKIDLAQVNYDIIDKVPVWAYFGNPEGLVTKRFVRDNDRIFYWNTFLDLFKTE